VLRIIILGTRPLIRNPRNYDNPEVLEIYATSVDYDPKAQTSIEFFKKVQNKIHFAVHGETAEVKYHMVDAEKEKILSLLHDDINCTLYIRKCNLCKS
jgi:hypothetical protein